MFLHSLAASVWLLFKQQRHIIGPRAYKYRKGMNGGANIEKRNDDPCDDARADHSFSDNGDFAADSGISAAETSVGRRKNRVCNPGSLCTVFTFGRMDSGTPCRKTEVSVWTGGRNTVFSAPSCSIGNERCGTALKIVFGCDGVSVMCGRRNDRRDAVLRFGAGSVFKFLFEKEVDGGCCDSPFCMRHMSKRAKKQE